jgi:putative ABC transport system permease protein
MEGEHQRPSLFLFDIQPEQTERLTHMMDKSSASLQHLSPLVSARLVSIKGKPVELDDDGFGREAEQRTRFRNRRLNLSARSQLSDSESMVSGRDFSGTFDPETNAPAEASLEVRYAERLGLNVDDIFTVDILGFQIKAKVVNLRKVRWTSFQPNFFVVFQPGVLDDAPKTYLSSIIDQREVDVVAKLQQQIVKTFPNIGVVDITQTLNRLLQVVNQMLFAIQVTAWVSLIAGFGVLFSIARQQLRARMKDLVLVSLLGAKSSSLRSMLLIEFSLLGFWAGGCGLVCGTMGSSAFSWFLFEGSLIPNISTSLLQWLGIILLTTITGLMSSWQSLSRPFSYAQQRKALA